MGEQSAIWHRVSGCCTAWVNLVWAKCSNISSLLGPSHLWECGCSCAGLKAELEKTNERLAEKIKDIKEEVYRFELLQASLARVEAELHASMRQKREAQLTWNDQCSKLEDQLRVRSPVYRSTLIHVCSLIFRPHKCLEPSSFNLLSDSCASRPWDRTWGVSNVRDSACMHACASKGSAASLLWLHSVCRWRCYCKHQLSESLLDSCKR
jgi:hypothetical protein